MHNLKTFAAACAVQLALCSTLSALGAPLSAGERPKLEIYWSRQCAPCAQLVNEWNTRGALYQWIKARFTVEWHESSDYPLPRMRVLGDELCGYAGPTRLVARLGQLLDVAESGERRAESGPGSQLSPLRSQQRSAECPPFNQQHGPQPTQVLQSLQQQLLAEADRREGALRTEFGERLTTIDERLSKLNDALLNHEDRLRELVAFADSAQAESGARRAESVELRAESRELRAESQVIRAQLSALSSQLSAVHENTLISRAPSGPSAAALDAADPRTNPGGSAADDRPPSPAPMPSVRAVRTQEGSAGAAQAEGGELSAELRELYARLNAIESHLLQPITVELFDSGKPLGLIKEVNLGGYLPLDIFGEERVLSNFPPMTTLEE